MSESETAWSGGVVHLHPDDDPLSSANLSRCITNISNAGMKHPLLLLTWRVIAGKEARRLYERCDDLGYNELNVLSYWYVRTKRVSEAGRTSHLGILTAETARENGQILPHQLALAYAVRALWVVMGTTKFSKEEEQYLLNLRFEALALEPEIYKEHDKLQALRQFVRVLRDLGKAELAVAHTFRAQELFNWALSLAEGEAKTESQARQLRALLRKVPKVLQ